MIKKIWRDAGIILSTIWVNLVLFAGFLFSGAALLKTFGGSPRAGWGQLLLDAFHLAMMERVETGGKPVPILLAFLLPVVTAVVLGEGILRVFAIYANRRMNRKEWNVMVAKTLKNHTVICGMGEMGQQLLRQMLVETPDMQVVLIDPRPGLLAELGLTDESALHFQSDMSDIAMLKQANVQQAALVVLSAGEDALNLETAYKVLQINADVPTWVRLHHSGLAELLELSQKPNIHFFCPYQQAAKAIVDHMIAK